jgi:hypothetical protein
MSSCHAHDQPRRSRVALCAAKVVLADLVSDSEHQDFRRDTRLISLSDANLRRIRPQASSVLFHLEQDGWAPQ